MDSTQHRSSETPSSSTDSWQTNPFREIVSDLMKETQNINEIQALIYAHEHFAPSEVLLQALICFYEANKPNDSLNESAPLDMVAARIINFIKNWVKVDRPKFSNSLRDLGKNLNEFRLTLPDVFNIIVKAALEEGGPSLDINEDGSDDANNRSGFPSPNLEARHRIATKSRKSNQPHQLTDFKPKDIAQHLTVIDQRLMKDIDLNELLGSKWTKEGQAPGLEKVAKRSDQFAYWILYEMIIVKVKSRTKLIAHIIEICAELIKLQNFQSLMNIFLAFNILPTEKINFLQDITSNLNYHNSYVVWQETCALLDFAGNFKNYREKIKTLSIPIVLSQEVLLKDLLFNEEASPNFDENGQLNRTKLFTMGSIVVNYSKCRNSEYDIPSLNPDLYKHLTNYPIVSLEVLEQLLDESSDMYKMLIRYRRGKLSNLLDPNNTVSSNDNSTSASQDTTSMSVSEKSSTSSHSSSQPSIHFTSSGTNSKEQKEQKETSTKSLKRLQFW